MDGTTEERILSLIKRRLPISDKDQRTLWQAYQKAKEKLAKGNVVRVAPSITPKP